MCESIAGRGPRETACGPRRKPAAPLVGSIVAGTDGVCFYVFEANSSRVVKTHRIPVDTVPTTRDGHAEQNPEAIVDAARACVDNALASGEVSRADVAAVGVANHRASVVAWDKSTGEPLCNAILWSDNRAARLANDYARAYGTYKFHRVCGLPFSPYFSAFKIAWLLRNVAAVANAHAQGRCYFGTVDTWLLWNLTGGVKGGVFATDSSNASHTFLMNINTLQWDASLLKFFGVSPKCLPAIKTSSEVYGRFADGSLVNVPISGVIGDRQAAIVGHRCFYRGNTKATLDTSGSVFTVTGGDKVFSANGLLTTVAYQLDAKPVYALEGPIASMGKSIEWAKSCLNVGDTTMAANQTSLGKVYFVPAFNGLYAPHWKPTARCLFVSKDECSSMYDIVNGAMESVGFQTHDVVKSMNADLNTAIDRIRVDGDLSNNGTIMQSVANLTGTKIEVANFKHMTALGAAMAAGNASEINVWKPFCMPDETDVACYHPKMAADKRAGRIMDWTKAVLRSYDWVDYPKKFNKMYLGVPLVSAALLLIGGFILLKK